MTRIVGGRWGGRTLVTPAGPHTRPTSEKVRAALGNSLQAGGGLAGATVLDLFAGSGAIGLELASRGAERVVLVDNDREAIAAARTNISTLNAIGVTIVPGSAISYPKTAGPVRFDIVVADPPYDLEADQLTTLLRDLYTHELLNPHADLVLERSRRSTDIEWPEPLAGVRSKRYGDTVLLFGQAP